MNFNTVFTFMDVILFPAIFNVLLFNFSIVEKTIKEAIIEHVFGGYHSGGSSGDARPEKGNK